MKMRFLFAFAALEIGFAVQALAPGLVNLSEDAKTLDEFIELSMKEAEAFNNNDATALAALFAEDAIYAAPEGVFYGRKAIRGAGLQTCSGDGIPPTLSARPTR